MTSGDGCIISYTAFDKPTRITKGGNTVEFFYGPDRKRFKRIDNTVEKGTVTTIYAAGKAYERIENAQGVTTKHYIGGIFAFPVGAKLLLASWRLSPKPSTPVP